MRQRAAGSIPAPATYQIKMSIEKTSHGAWRVSDIVRGYLVTRTFFGYTKRQAASLFREEFPEE